jgi:dimethylaniline monooxygenase (N-oxide forming)
MGCFKAKHMNAYLESYVDHFTFSGTTMRSRIKFNFAVQKVEKLDEKWVISGPEVIHAAKVMVASGLASSANMPDLPFRERFEGQVIHQEDFGQSQDAIFSDPEIKHITVLGGAKSSADMIYSAVKAGKSVSWIIRTQGSGPGFFLNAKGAGPYKNALELGSTRFAGSLSPSFTNPRSLLSRFLHETWLGRKVVDMLWTAVDNPSRADAGFANREAKGGFEHLAPDTT